MGNPSIPLSAISRLPDPYDNVAIATRILPTGTLIEIDGHLVTTDVTILLGHRFAIRPIAEGDGLLSWGLPFGIATRPIQPGQYVANDGMIEALHGRTFEPDLNYTFPKEANFRDRIVPYEINQDTFQPGKPLERYNEKRTFMGYKRPVTNSSQSRGVGTRNMVVILGTTSSTAAFARALAEKLQPEAANYPNVDGIVPIAHTEGSGYQRINNRDFLLRALAGLMVHPNVGAVLAVDLPDPHDKGAINNQVLRQYMAENDYPLDDVLHHFHSLSASFSEDMDHCARLVQGWLPIVNDFRRSPTSISHLSIALQCGGSDAFSGVSGNPLAASVVKEVIRYGGRANLAETDELIGSEAYVLQNVRSLELARKFLNYIALFKERLSWHGQSAEGNPSGGNKYRGLYNIALKSIGAAAKRHPDVQLDHVVDYGQRMLDPGYYFMNTPGNDLESIAGQVAGGSNLIIFITGNGSITNFPFVPTIKVMTTTQRYQLLENEMDVNAGAYLDGTPMNDLTAETLDLLIDIASGQPSKGELAGHSQVSIWRNWQQTDRSRLPLILERERPSGQPIPLGDLTGNGDRHLGMPTSLGRVDEDEASSDAAIPEDGASPDAAPLPNTNRGKIGLIIPTSLCSGQIAQLATEKLNATCCGADHPLDRFATLVHTEGCGVAFASTREIYAQTMVGYATHPLVGACLFLEHGCEKAHNDYLHSLIAERGLAREDFGWASVQLDGGIEKVFEKIRQYFQMENVLERSSIQSASSTTVALMSEGELTPDILRTFANITAAILASRGTVIIPSGTALTQSPFFWETFGLGQEPVPTLAYGQSVNHPGLHLMETPTSHWTETMTGLGATGAEAIVAFTDKPRARHPFVPVVTIGTRAAQATVDVVLDGDISEGCTQLLDAIVRTLSGTMAAEFMNDTYIDFQLTRGWLGIST